MSHDPARWSWVLAGPLACAVASCSPAPRPSPPVAPASALAPVAQVSASTAPAEAPSAARPEPPPAPELPAVRLVAVEPTPPEGKPPTLQLTAPSRGQVITASKVASFDVKLGAKGWRPAAGDHLCVALDRRPCRRVDDPSRPLKLGDLGPADVLAQAEGLHVVSLLARRASGEFFRGSGKSVPYAGVTFYVDKKVASSHKDGAPMIFLGTPEPGPAPGSGVLLDFFVVNAELKKGGFVVTASVGGPGMESGAGLSLDASKPLRIENARPGEYLSRVTLMQYAPELSQSKADVSVTYTAKAVPGPFGAVERSFVVTR